MIIKKPILHNLRRSRFLFLLVSMVVLFLASPFLDDSLAHKSYLLVLMGLVMIAAVRIASERRSHWIISLMLGVLWLVLGLWGLVGQETVPMIAASLLFIVLSVYVLGVVLGSVVSAVDVDFDILLGAASVYLLIGLIWAFTYLVIHQLDPGAFSLVHGEARPFFLQFLYFSLTTLTTLGYGDLTPLSPFAQVWSAMEAIVGTLYIALLVARLVGIYQIQRSRRR